MRNKLIFTAYILLFFSLGCQVFQKDKTDIFKRSTIQEPSIGFLKVELVNVDNKISGKVAELDIVPGNFNSTETGPFEIAQYDQYNNLVFASHHSNPMEGRYELFKNGRPIEGKKINVPKTKTVFRFSLQQNTRKIKLLHSVESEQYEVLQYNAIKL